MPSFSLKWAVLVALGAFAAGCDPFTGLDFRIQTEMPPGATVGSRSMTMVEGRAVGFIAVPKAGDDTMEDAVVELKSKNPTIAGVGRSLEDNAYVVWGVAPGQTTISVTVRGVYEGELPVRVQVQR